MTSAISVIVNGEARELDGDATVASVVALLEVPAQARGVAVALDGEVVARGAWPTATLHDGARVEVLSAIGGG